jgi:hypothetical protein
MQVEETPEIRQRWRPKKNTKKPRKPRKSPEVSIKRAFLIS